MKAKISAALALAFTSMAAQASIHSYQFSTTITSVEQCASPWDCHATSGSPLPGESIAVGQTMFGSITYNTDTPVESSSFGWYSYYATYAAQGAGTGNGGSLSFSNSALGITGPASTQRYWHSITDSMFGMDYVALGVVVETDTLFQSMDLSFRDYDGTAVTFGLPAGLQLEQYELAYISYAYMPKDGAGASFRVGGVLTSLQAVSAVPEPTTYAMFAAGLGLLGVRRGARRAGKQPGSASSR